MISREELQQVKDYVDERRHTPVDGTIWRGGFKGSHPEDNQRILDLLEAAEHYAREDTLKEVEDRLMP